jgi:group I intron endonuclease
MIYIGSTVNSISRWKGHVKSLREQKHHSKHLQRAWNKYGEKNFVFEIIEEVLDKSNLTGREQYYLDIHESYNRNKGYNICPKAGFNTRGASFYKTKEWRDKQRKAHLGKNKSQKTRQKMSESRKGIKFSQEHKTNLSNALKDKLKGEGNPMHGKKHSEETKQKMREKAVERNLKNRNIRAKLSDIMIYEIRNLHPKLSYKKIASLYNVHFCTIRNIIKNKTYKNIEV